MSTNTLKKERSIFAPYKTIMARIAQALDRDVIKPAEIAKLLGITRQSIDVFRRNDSFPAERIVRFCLQKKLNPTFLATGKGPPKVQHLHQDGGNLLSRKLTIEGETEGMIPLVNEFREIMESGNAEAIVEITQAIQSARSKIVKGGKKLKHA